MDMPLQAAILIWSDPKPKKQQAFGKNYAAKITERQRARLEAKKKAETGGDLWT